MDSLQYTSPASSFTQALEFEQDGNLQQPPPPQPLPKAISMLSRISDSWHDIVPIISIVVIAILTLIIISSSCGTLARVGATLTLLFYLATTLIIPNINVKRIPSSLIDAAREVLPE